MTAAKLYHDAVLDAVLDSALKLYDYLLVTHWTGHALVGPDPGVRFNYRMGRFVKSYLPQRNWNDSYYYLQAQGYWIYANWRLFRLTGDAAYQQTAIACSDMILAQQRTDGAWEYPNREWKGRIATVEGIWAALGLLATYEATGEANYREGAARWHGYMVNHIQYQQIADEMAINYFAKRNGARVPNNSTMVLVLLAELAKATGDGAYLSAAPGLVTFLRREQLPSGELPYAVGGIGAPGYFRQHLQCYQYNAFQCIDLMNYYAASGDAAVRPLIEQLLHFVHEGLAAEGNLYYDCSKPPRRVTYHAAAAGAAFKMAGQLGFAGYDEPCDRAYRYLLAAQQANGSFLHSQHDYRLLTDRRSYPRYLAMILFHLLIGSEGSGSERATLDKAELTGELALR